MSKAASTTPSPPVKLLLLLGIRRRGATGDPRPAVVGGISLPGDARVDPDDVAVAEEPVGGDRRIGEVAVHGPRPAVRSVGAITCQIGSIAFADAPSSNTRRRNTALRSICRTPGRSNSLASTIASSLSSCAFRMQATSSGVLSSLAGTHHIGRVDPVDIGQRPQDRMRLVVDADAGARREVVGDRRGEQLDAVVEIREQWAVQMVVRQVVWHPVAVHACRGAAPNLPSPQRQPCGTARPGRRPGPARRHPSHTRPSSNRAEPGRRRPARRVGPAAARTVRAASGRCRASPGSPARRSSRPPANRRWLNLLKDAKIAQWAARTSAQT